MDKQREIVIPPEMETAARRAWKVWKQNANPAEDYSNGAVAAIKAAIQWLIDHPIEPTKEQEFALHEAFSRAVDVQSEAGGSIAGQIRFSVIEWQRQMFLSSNEEEPILDLLTDLPADGRYADPHKRPPVDVTNERIREAFRRGQKSAKDSK